MATLVPSPVVHAIPINSPVVMEPVVPNLTIRSVAAVTCVLSVIGSLVIIITYFGYKSLRTTPRLILVHISLMDLGVALSNFVGVSVNFNSYYFNTTNISYVFGLPQAASDGDVPVAIRYGCLIQAGTAVYFTVGSFLWAISMAVYLYLRIVHHEKPAAARHCFYASIVACYLLPLLIILWKGFTHRLGFSPFASEGWCGDKLIDLQTGQRQIFMDVIGYELWVGLTFILVPILYLSVICYIYLELKGLVGISQERFWAAVHNLDYKLLLIPLAFLLLRIWSVVDTVAYVYMMKSFPKGVHYTITCLSAIGDSGQGFLNALLFVGLTKKVRQKICPCYRCRRGQLTKSQEKRKLLYHGTSVQRRRYGSNSTTGSSSARLISPSISHN